VKYAKLEGDSESSSPRRLGALLPNSPLSFKRRTESEGKDANNSGGIKKMGRGEID